MGHSYTKEGTQHEDIYKNSLFHIKSMRMFTHIDAQLHTLSILMININSSRYIYIRCQCDVYKISFIYIDVHEDSFLSLK